MKKVALVVVIVLLVSLTALYLTRPWVITVALEGFPDNTWPAAGNFSEQGLAGVRAQTGADRTSNRLVETSAFTDQFESSQGLAFVLATEGEIAYSQYADGYSAETKFNSFSMSKSLVGVLVLKAVSDGEIAGLDSTVGDAWPKARTSEIAPTTIRDLLDMRSGIAFEKDPDIDENPENVKRNSVRDYGPTSNFARLHVEGVDSVLFDITVVAEDRGTFSYQNVNTAILGRILEEVYATPLDQLLYEQIVQPAGAQGFYWRQYSSEDRVSPYCCLYATTQWWVKVGQFLLRNGGSSPLLSGEMFSYFMGDDISGQDIRDGEYRSQTRYDILDRQGEQLQGRFMLLTGRGGQAVYLLPGQGAVVVRFGENYQPLYSTLYEMSRLEPK